MRGDCTESSDDGAIDSTTVEEEDADDFLDPTFVSGWQLVAGVFRLCKLRFGTVVGFGPGMWRMLGFGWMGMSKAKEGSFDIPRHGYIDGALVIIPSEGKATVFGAGPIGFEHVFLG